MQLAERTMASTMFGVGQVATLVQMAQDVAKAALSEAAFVHGQVEGQIQTYILRIEAGMLCTIREDTHNWKRRFKPQHLEQSRQACNKYKHS